MALALSAQRRNRGSVAAGSKSAAKIIEKAAGNISGIENKRK
jgi:hypothetical protein